MKKNLKRVFSVMFAVALVLALAIPAFAAGDPVTTDDTVDVMKTAFEGAVSSILSGVGVILPIALGIMATFLTINLGVKFFKKLTGKAS